ncbi:hypothetical protein EDD11_008713 [Mortierella claussenii]|nr:hypothetical protein EDD11_008713 [Mortierella claussenii]
MNAQLANLSPRVEKLEIAAQTLQQTKNAQQANMFQRLKTLETTAQTLQQATSAQQAIIIQRLEKLETAAQTQKDAPSQTFIAQDHNQPQLHQPQQQQKQQQQQQQQQPSCYDDDDSPKRQQLRARVELIKNILYEIELPPAPVAWRPVPPRPAPPRGLAAEDDPIFQTWLNAGNDEAWYQRKLLTMLEEVQAEEEALRRQIRDINRHVYADGISPHARRLREKIDAVKKASVEFYPHKSAGKSRPPLQTDPSSMDVDLFIVWCLRSDAFKDYKRVNGLDVNGQKPGHYLYEQELGVLMARLLELEEREKRYRLHFKATQEWEENCWSYLSLCLFAWPPWFHEFVQMLRTLGPS